MSCTTPACFSILSRGYGEPTYTANGTACPNYINIIYKVFHFQLCNPLHTSMNQQLLERTSAIKVAIMKTIQCYRRFLLWKEAATDSILLSAKVTKEDAGKQFMENEMYILWYAKRHLSGWSNVEQWNIRPVPLTIVELCLLKASVSQAKITILVSLISDT